MKIQLPWAKRRHYHPDPTLLKYTTCAKCRHLLLIGHVDNQKVEVFDRSHGVITMRTELYGKFCAPNYDRTEMAVDGKVRFYMRGNEVKL